MHKIVSLAILMFVLSSCAQVFFDKPQPQKGSVVKSFIDDVQGDYSDSLLDIKILKKEIIIGADRFALTSKTPTENEVLVKYHKDFYFASFADSIYYSVYMAKPYDNKLAIYVLNADELSRKRIERIVPLELLDSQKTRFLARPSKKEFDQLIDYEMFEVLDVIEKIEN